jgi:hypothetical protein
MAQEGWGCNHESGTNHFIMDILQRRADLIYMNLIERAAQMLGYMQRSSVR